jgi:hypothetical protein
MNSSPLAAVIPQLFPFLVGGTLNLKEIVANKAVIIKALQQLATKLQTKNLTIDNGKLYSGNGCCVADTSNKGEEATWKWFADNFLSLTFVKGEGYGQELPIHTTILVATAVTKLYSRFNIASALTDEQQDAIHTLKHKFDMWMCNGCNNDGFTISLKEVALMQQILIEYKTSGNPNFDLSVLKNRPNQEWVANTVTRIDNNIESCLSYLETLV